MEDLLQHGIEHKKLGIYDAGYGIILQSTSDAFNTAFRPFNSINHSSWLAVEGFEEKCSLGHGVVVLDPGINGAFVIALTLVVSATATTGFTITVEAGNTTIYLASATVNSSSDPTMFSTILIYPLEGEDEVDVYIASDTSEYIQTEPGTALSIWKISG